jgi:hypothetical protein
MPLRPRSQRPDAGHAERQWARIDRAEFSGRCRTFAQGQYLWSERGVVMWGRQRQRELEAHLGRLAGKVAVIETIGGMVIGLMLRAVPDNSLDGILRNLRKSMTTRSEGATSADVEAFQLEIEEFAQQLLDQIEGVARREFDAL